LIDYFIISLKHVTHDKTIHKAKHTAKSARLLQEAQAPRLPILNP